MVSGTACLVSFEVPEKRSPDLRFSWLDRPPGVLLPGVALALPDTSMSTTMSSDSSGAPPLMVGLLGSAELPGAGFGVEPIWSSDNT